jgi:hypothetical protein
MTIDIRRRRSNKLEGALTLDILGQRGVVELLLDADPTPAAVDMLSMLELL